jgi:hypothetical protein
MGTTTRWLAVLVALATGACAVDNEEAEADPGADAAAAGGQGGDGGQSGEQPAPDAGGGAGGAGGQDGAGGQGGAGGGPADACVEACARMSACSIEVCEGFEAGDAGALGAACAAACGPNPAFATVVRGAEGCDTVVDFGRSVFDDAYRAACESGEPEPDPDDPSTCRFPCADEGEACREGHCVRADGSCVTDYHCRTGVETCEEGRCVPAQFAECRSSADCHEPAQSCRFFDQDPLANGSCVFTCETDDQCPQSEMCMPAFGNICYYAFCGAGQNNGTVYGACTLGGNGQWGGVCYPLARGSQPPGGGEIGVCLEGGSAAKGAPCDSQAEGRDEAARALQCGPGLICFGDDDDPENPVDPPVRQGTCVSLCDPRAPACAEDEACLDFSAGDSPETPGYDDTLAIGVCYPSDCDVLEPDACPEGEACRAYVLTLRAGQCHPAGQAGALEPCETSDDCAGGGICGDAEGGTVCYLPCDVEGDPCPEGLVCYADPTWAVGICVNPGM